MSWNGMNINKKAKTMGFFFLHHNTFLGFSIFLYSILFKDDSQLCYKIYNKIIWYTILFYAICV